MFLENLYQVLRFATVGVVNTAIDWTIYFIVLLIFPNESIYFYTAVKAFSYCCATINSFFMNRYWTFKALPVNEALRFVKFVLVNLTGLAVNSASVFVFLSLSLGHLPSLALATAITFLLNFSLNKLWVFRKDKLEAGAPGGK